MNITSPTLREALELVVDLAQLQPGQSLTTAEGVVISAFSPGDQVRDQSTAITFTFLEGGRLEVNYWGREVETYRLDQPQ